MAGVPIFSRFRSTSGVPQIGSQQIVARRHNVISDALAGLEGAHAGAIDRAYMHKHVARSVAWGDEPAAIVRAVFRPRMQIQ